MSERTVCSIRGCSRSTARDVEEWICSPHWRAGIPPRSPQRKVWIRAIRLGRKFGWTEERIARVDRIWEWLKARCQAAADGDIDRREIDKLFGWDA